MRFAADTVRPMEPLFVIHGIPNIESLDDNCRIWILSTKIWMTPNITYWSASDHAVQKVTAAGDSVADYRKENYKNDFEIWNKSSILQSECKNIYYSPPNLDSIPVGAKNLDAKSTATDSSARKERGQK